AYGAHDILPYTEDAPLQANHPYDASKAMAEYACRAYANTYGTPIAVTRCANIYGEGDTNFARIVPCTARDIHAGRNPVILSDGTPVRDYVHVDDVVAAYLAILGDFNAANGKAFNFGSGAPVSVLTLVERMIAVSGRTDMKPDVRGRVRVAGEIDRQYLSNTRARETFGWQPRVPLDDGLKRALSWYGDYLRGR
ncbi:MAG: NAD-dependent epimerase/dehydratase family protein, partial [Candidatus Thermoplasmatota archaeon]